MVRFKGVADTGGATQEARASDCFADKTKWMSSLGEMRLCEMSIPGTHDTVTGCRLNNQIETANNLFARCQTKDIRGQLNDGIRFLDIRLKLQNAELILVHGGFIYGTNFSEDVLKNCTEFLSENKTETIIMSIKYEDPTGNEPIGAFEAAGSLLDPYTGEVYQQGRKDDNANFGSFIEKLSGLLKPVIYDGIVNSCLKLKECAGKIVILKRFEDKDNKINGLDLSSWMKTKNCFIQDSFQLIPRFLKAKYVKDHIKKYSKTNGWRINFNSLSFITLNTAASIGTEVVGLTLRFGLGVSIPTKFLIAGGASALYVISQNSPYMNACCLNESLLEFIKCNDYKNFGITVLDFYDHIGMNQPFEVMNGAEDSPKISLDLVDAIIRTNSLPSPFLDKHSNLTKPQRAKNSKARLQK